MRNFFVSRMMLWGVFLLTPLFAGLYAQEASNHPRTLNIGFSSQSFPKGVVKDAEIAIKSLADALSERTAARFQKAAAVIFEDLAELDIALGKKEIDILGLVTLDYIQLENSLPMIPFFVASYENSPYMDLVIVVRKESAVEDLTQLRNTILLIDTRNKERLAKLWIDVLLLRAALPPREMYFKEIVEVEKASQAILPVFFDRAAACITSRRALNTMVELNPQVGRELRIIQESAQLLAGVVCVRDDMLPDDRETILDTLENIHAEPEGEQLLMILQIDRLVPFDLVHLQTTRALFDEFRRLSKGNRSRAPVR